MYAGQQKVYRYHEFTPKTKVGFKMSNPTLGLSPWGLNGPIAVPREGPIQVPRERHIAVPRGRPIQVPRERPIAVPRGRPI